MEVIVSREVVIDEDECPVCKGSGSKEVRDETGKVVAEKDCPQCEGNGVLV